jgi:DNA-binding CsgD family transcriptional regulator
MGELGWSNLIADLYDAASGDVSFSPLAAKIAAAFDCKSCNLHVRNGFAGPVEQVTVTANYTPELLTSYDAHYYQHDVWANRGMRHPPGSVLGSDDLISDSEFRESIIYREHARFAQTFRLMGAILPIGGADGAFGAFGVHRSETEAPFSKAEKRQAEVLLPHLKRALQLRERLAQMDIRQQAMLQAMECLALGVMLVTGTGKLLFANPAAEALLRGGSGLVMVHNRLHAVAPSADPALQRLLQCATQATIGRASEAGGLLRLPRQGAKPISLSVYPFFAPASSGLVRAPSALIFISDPALHGSPRRDVLAQVYGLTKAEAKLFESLLAGDRLQDYADRSSLSLQTVKTQLARLFHKTGSTRQPELMKEGLSNPILSLTKRVVTKT